MINEINRNNVKLSLLIGVKNENIEEYLEFLYEIIDTLQTDGKLNSNFTKRDLKRKVKTRLSFIESNDIGEHIQWLVKNTDWIDEQPDRTGGGSHYRLKGHPWE